MTENRSCEQIEMLRKSTELLRRLPGIYAANVRAGEDGEIREIHVLACNNKNPKQLGRDIQSALFALLGVWVDHRIISIAQISGEPEAEEGNAHVVSAARLKYRGYSARVEDGSYKITVNLDYDGCEYAGESECRDSELQRPLAAARATLCAVQEYLDASSIFSLITMQTVKVSDWSVVVAIVEYRYNGMEQLLVGAAQLNGGETLSAVRATLDALNRLFVKLAAIKN